MREFTRPKHLIVIAGPTASGKSSLAIKIAKLLNCCVVSADSRQVYKGLDIGTAKIKKDDMNSVPHYFIDHVELDESYNVGLFEKQVISFLDVYFENNDYAVLAGGTGLYIRAVLEGLDEFPDISNEIISELESDLANMGMAFLQKELKEHDPEYYDSVDLHNKHRLIRALSVIRQTERKFSSFVNASKVIRSFESHNILLDVERSVLYERINKRVDQMLKEGLISEARELYKFKSYKALQTVGYKELFDHFDNQISLEEAVELIKRNSRRYAKRQLTWFRKYFQGQSFEASQTDEIINWIKRVT